MPLYRVSGITLSSAVPLPLWPAGPGDTATSVLRVGTLPERLPQSLASDRPDTSLEGPDRVLIRNGNDGVLVEGGVVLTVNTDRSERVVELMSSALAVLLHQRGLLVLHASSVKMGQKAVAFVGGSGAGKSTMAALLMGLGALVLADDVLVVNVSAGDVRVEPVGLPLRLSTEALTLTELQGGLRTDKALVATPEAEGCALAGVYDLAWGPELGVFDVPASERVPLLLRDSFCSRLVTHAATGGRHLEQCGEVARVANVRRLLRPRGAEYTYAIHAAIMRDLNSSAEDSAL